MIPTLAHYRDYDRPSGMMGRFIANPDYRAPILPHSLHLPLTVVDGSLTEKINKTGVRLWTDLSLLSLPCTPEQFGSSMRR